MKKNLTGYTIICLLLLPLSCRKDYDRIDYFRNPLKGGCQVAEYHIPIYDSYFPHFVFLFKKTFDSTGRKVKSIMCNFWDEIPPNQANSPEFRHNFLVVQKDMKVYLINLEPGKAGIPDTVARITLNKDGRAISCEATGALNPDLGNPPVTNHFIYRNDHIVAVKTDLAPPFTNSTDSVYYDQHGNVSSFKANTYQYDYTKRANQQFYCDDFMGGAEEPFYLLQYLGFFPEVNSPVNIRTHVETEVGRGDLTDHQFDANGRLVSYVNLIFSSEPVTISWNCNR